MEIEALDNDQLVESKIAQDPDAEDLIFMITFPRQAMDATDKNYSELQIENDDLRKQIKEAEEYLASLYDERVRVTQDCSNLDYQYEEIKVEQDLAEQDIAAVQPLVTRLKKRIAAFHKQRPFNEVVVDKEIEKNEAIRREIEETKEKVEKLTKTCESKQILNRELLRQIEEYDVILDGSEASLKKMVARVKRLEGQVAKYTEQLRLKEQTLGMLKRSIAETSKQKEMQMSNKQQRELEEAKKELASKENQLLIMREMVKGRQVQYRQVDQEITRIKNSPGRKSPAKGPTPKPALGLHQADDSDLLSIDDNSDLDPQKFETSFTGMDNYDIDEEQDDRQGIDDLEEEDEDAILRDILAETETPDIRQDSVTDDLEDNPLPTKPKKATPKAPKPKAKPLVMRDPGKKQDNLVAYLEQTKDAPDAGNEQEEDENQGTHAFEVSQNDVVAMESPAKQEKVEDDEA